MMTHPLDNHNLQRHKEHDDDEQQQQQEELLNSLVRDLSFWELPERLVGRSQSVDGGSTRSASDAANNSLQESSRRAKRRSMRRTRSSNEDAVALSSLKNNKKKQTNGSSSSRSRDYSQQQQQQQHAGEAAADHPAPTGAQQQRVWKTALDPVSGRTYYYDSITRKTQWEKPAEIRAMEKKHKQEKRKAERAFFDTMKANLLASLRRGELLPGIPRGQMVQLGPPKEPLLMAVSNSNSNSDARPAQIRVRTISGMNEQLLAELHNDHGGATTSHHTSSSNGTPHHPPLPVASSRPVTSTTTTTTVSSGVVNGTGSSSLRTTAAGNGGGPSAAAEGRPPLPQRRPTHNKPAAGADDSMELSPEEQQPSHLASTEDVPPESELLRGESLLDGPILGEQLEPGAALTVPSLSTTTTNNSNATATTTATSSPNSTSTSHVRRNTGGTIYVQSTMENPDVNATIKCVCGVYRAHIVQAAAAQHPNQRSPVSVHNNTTGTTNVNLDIFRDDYESRNNNSTVSYQNLDRNYYNNSKRDGGDADNAATTTTIPSLAEIETFYHDFYKRSQMEHDTIIMSLIYVERLIKETNGVLTPAPNNWQSILFSCMVLSSKVWDDLSMFNLDFSNVSMASSGLSSFSLQRTNALELAVLTSLNFNVRVPASEYAKYYFLIRTMLSRSGLLQEGAANLPLTKKDDEGKVLESRSSHYQDSRLQGRSGRRTRSVDFSVQKPVLKDTVCLEQLVSMDR